MSRSPAIRRKPASAPASEPAAVATARSARTFYLALVGSVLWWASLPPLGAWPLAWLAPVSWCWLIRQPQLVGRRPYLAIWLAGFCFYLATFHFLRLPHPAMSLGWLALSAYLACYLPAFVAIARVAVQRLSVPLLVAAPVTWVGLEYLQAHLLSGISFGTLGHSQYRWLTVIQIADLAGQYLVSALVVLVGASLARMLPMGDNGGTRRPAWRHAVPAALAMAAALGYGTWRINDIAQPAAGSTSTPLTIALVQGSIPSDVKADADRNQEILDQYVTLSEQVLAKAPGKIDLLVWPETMYRESLIVVDQDATPPADSGRTLEELHDLAQSRRHNMQDLAAYFKVPTLLGVDTIAVRRDRTDRYNSAVLVTGQQVHAPRYDKMHPVMFGEYIPFGDWFPWLYQVSPLGSGLASGARAESIQVMGASGSARLAPNICYESALPHLIRNQMVELRARGEEPDIILTLTNDGWFHGSSELDLHLICGVFRAVENRKPFLTAANTGFSAWVAADGTIVKQAPRMATGTIVAQPEMRDIGSIYGRHGDLLALGCLVLTGGAAAAGAFWRRKHAT